MSDDYVTLRCRAERHELCRTHAETRCRCHCHWQLFDDQTLDAADQLDRAYQPLAALLKEHTA